MPQLGLALAAQGGAIVVRSVQLGGPAALSGRIAVGDIIVSVGGQAVGGDRDKAGSLSSGESGTNVQLIIQDDAKVHSTVTLVRQDLIVQAPASPPMEAGIGVKIERQQGDTVVVLTAMPTGGASDVGGLIKLGDVLMSVDGKDVSGMACKVIAPLMSGAPGTRVRLGVKRGTETLDVAVIRNPAIDSAALPKLAAYKAAAAKADAAAAAPAAAPVAAPDAAPAAAKAAAPAPAAAKAAAPAAAPAAVEGGEKKGEKTEEGGEKKKTKGELKAEAYAAKMADRVCHPPTLTERPYEPFSNLRFTLTDRFGGGFCQGGSNLRLDLIFP